MRECLILDLETIPCQDLPADCIPQFDETSVKLGNLKDEAKIAAKIEQGREAWEAGLDKKMSLDPDLCEVICVGYCDGTEATGIYGELEFGMVYEAWHLITTAYYERKPLVTFNGIGFDLPVLLHRAMYHNILVDPLMYANLTRRYSIKHHIDLMQVLADWDRQRFKGRSLEFYAKRFGLGDKIGDASMIYQWWQNKEWDKITGHCKADVMLTHKLFRRVEPWYVTDKGEDE